MAVFIFVWFTSLSMISSRSIHPCCCRWHHCILFYESVVFHCVCVYIHTYVHTTSSFFIHLMMDIEVTPSLVIVNGATLNTGCTASLPGGCWMAATCAASEMELRPSEQQHLYLSLNELLFLKMNLKHPTYYVACDISRQTGRQTGSLWLSLRFIWRSLWLTLLKSHT